MKAIHDLSFFLPVAIGVFWGIVFLQSAIDKIVDFKGNKSWLVGHFSKTFLAPMVSPMLVLLTILELIAGLVSVYGVIHFMINGDAHFIVQGVIASMISLLMLIFGQRIAKDYEGAKTIAIYFGIALLSGLVLI